jgi:hypothetical protein
MLQDGELGIHPPGALGVAYFVHAGADSIIGHSGDGITQPLKEAGALRLQDPTGVRAMPLEGRIFANLLEADACNRTPELLMACCNPDQLEVLTVELTRFLENLAARHHLRSVEDVRCRVPILLILPNGILSEQTLETYASQLNEARLLDRLPGVTETMVEALLDRVVRGISLQAGGRRGSGAETIYVLEGKGTLVFAGGGERERERVEAVLTDHNYPCMHVRGVPGTRIEFDKAMISIVLNVGGLIHTVKPSGELIDLRMGDLCKDPARADFVHDVTRAVFDVGKAIAAYGPDDSYDQVWAKHRATILKFSGHVTSSLKTFRDALAGGLDGVKLFANEEWVLTPLARYAANAGLKDEERLFRALGHKVQEAMARAIKYRDQASVDRGSRGRTMKLTAQRNITIELFETGKEDVVLVGTLLDHEHLVKLELTVHLPDEQIIQSRASMIRVPFPVCHEVELIAERLVGLRIERGVLPEIDQRVGGSAGCSHIKELATGIMHFAASYLVGRRGPGPRRAHRHQAGGDPARFPAGAGRLRAVAGGAADRPGGAVRGQGLPALPDRGPGPRHHLPRVRGAGVSDRPPPDRPGGRPRPPDLHDLREPRGDVPVRDGRDVDQRRLRARVLRLSARPDRLRAAPCPPALRRGFGPASARQDRAVCVSVDRALLLHGFRRRRRGLGSAGLRHAHGRGGRVS